MNRWMKTAVLAAAVAAVPLFIHSTAHAQYRLNEDGHALDASNRIGSGGANPHDSYKRVGEPLNGNDIVTGNVTGGKQFRGGVPYTDPRAFRNANGSNGVNLDDFIKQSSGSGPDARMAQNVQPFYGAGRAVAPPPGYTQVAPGSGGYVPDTSIVTRVQGDQRLGNLDLANPQVALPQPGEMFLAGQVDPTAGQTYIFASPTAGIRTLSAQEMNSFTTNTQYNPVGNKLDEQSIQRMRDEMNSAAGFTPSLSNPANPTDANPASANPANPAAPGEPGANALPGAGPVNQQPVNQANVAKPVNNNVTAAAGNTNTNQTTYNMPAVAAPEKQSSIYAEMLQRYQQRIADPTLTDEQRSREFNKLKAEKDKADAGQTAQAPGQPGAAPTAPDAAPAAPGAAPRGPATQPAANVPDFGKRGEEILKKGANDKIKPDLTAKRPEPVKVPSLAQGMKGKGISEFMKSAEAAMKDGKFTVAFENYDKAEQIAPNNPLIKLGRANTELGANYYARADAHLRDVFTTHPEMLVAQYNLTSMLGEQRVQNLVRELKDISKKDQREARPLFLLAYIAYNTGHEQDAEAYLDLADKRSGGTDPFYKLLRENWSLPAAKTAAPEANK